MRCGKFWGERGFTLVEIAIVLVIIGLLIGGILKGREMIKNAKIKRIVKTADELRSTIMSFYDRYGVYPGDENKRDIPPGDSHNGNGDGKINTTDESKYMFEDLQKAGFISGNFDGTNFMQHVFGGDVYVQYTTVRGLKKHWIIFKNIPGDVGRIIDTKYDDGKDYSGSIRANKDYGNSQIYLYIEL